MDGCKIAVIGATGAVGLVFLEILHRRKFPYGSLRLCASERSIGEVLSVGGQEYTIEEATPKLFSEVDIVFISANGEVSRQLAPIAVQQGALVIDDSSVFRMNPEVPLVVPEINIGDLDFHQGIIAIPNCSTTPLAMVLKPLTRYSKVKRVIVDTYQSVSGAGSAAKDELMSQTNLVMSNETIQAKALPHQIAFNAIPHIEPFTANGYTREEMKVSEETRKILHEPNLAISATCVRVPVMVSHSEAIHIEFEDPLNETCVRDILKDAPGVLVLDDPDTNVYPMPIEATGKDEILVGRIRSDISHPNGIAMWIVADNLRKGAALNAIQIAEEIVQRGLL